MPTALVDVDLAEAVRDDDTLAGVLPSYEDVWRAWGLDPDAVAATTNSFAGRILLIRPDLVRERDADELADLMRLFSAVMMRGFALGLRVGQHEWVELNEVAL